MEIEKSQKRKKPNISSILSFFLFRNLIKNYNNDKDLNEEERKNIKKYGLISIILATIALFFSVSCFLSNIIGNDLLGFSYIIMVLIYIIGGVFFSIILSIYGFIFGVLQTRLNRKAIGIFGIVLSSISAVISVMLIFFMFM